MSAILVLYDLQDDLKNMSEGPLPQNGYVAPWGDTPADFNVVRVGPVKTIHVTNRKQVYDGLAVYVPSMTKLWPEDRITVTGRIGMGASKSDWSMAIDKYDGDYTTLSQHLAPDQSELFSISYLLDVADLDNPIIVHSDDWGKRVDPIDFYVDSILITRDVKDKSMVIEERKEIYSLAKDSNILTLNPGDVTDFIQTSGAPKYEVSEKDSKKRIRIFGRMNNWDGLDILLKKMNLKPGNRYTLHVKGRIDGLAPPRSELMLQIVPGYIWRSEEAVVDNQPFTLSHTFSIMELQNAEAVRVASNVPGSDMAFYIDEIVISSRKLEQ